MRLVEYEARRINMRLAEKILEGSKGYGTGRLYKRLVEYILNWSKRYETHYIGMKMSNVCATRRNGKMNVCLGQIGMRMVELSKRRTNMNPVDWNRA